MPDIQMGTETWYTVTIEDAWVTSEGEVETIDEIRVYNQDTDEENVVDDPDEIDYVLGWMSAIQEDLLDQEYVAELKKERQNDPKRH